MPKDPQTHPLEVNTSTLVNVRENVSIEMTVKGYDFNTVDQAYHYHLEGTFTDGNNAATVQLGDVHQSLIILQ